MGCLIKLTKEGEEMKKKRLAVFFFIGLVSSVFLFIHPINSWAKSTTMTITFSDQKQETTVKTPIEIPVIKHTKEKKEYELSFLAKSDQRLTRSFQRRLPTTGEEYNTVLSYLGWATLVFIFLIGSYERNGRDRHE